MSSTKGRRRGRSAERPSTRATARREAGDGLLDEARPRCGNSGTTLDEGREQARRRGRQSTGTAAGAKPATTSTRVAGGTTPARAGQPRTAAGTTPGTTLYEGGGAARSQLRAQDEGPATRRRADDVQGGHSTQGQRLSRRPSTTGDAKGGGMPARGPRSAMWARGEGSSSQTLAWSTQQVSST
jgi:hypothetical protein